MTVPDPGAPATAPSAPPAEVPSAPPRHAGSRVVEHQPNLVRKIKELEARIDRIAAMPQTEILTWSPADPARGEPVPWTTFGNALETLVYRSGSVLLADVVCGTGESSALEVHFWVPLLSLAGPVVASPVGNLQRRIRIRLDLPPEWAMGAAYATFVRARRSTGTEATTVRVVRSWQR